MSDGSVTLGRTHAVTPRAVTPHGILTAKLDSLRAHIGHLEGAAPGVGPEIQQAWELADGLDPYITRCTSPESPALRALARRTRAEDWSRRGTSGVAAQLEQEMLSGHVEGQILKFLVHLTRATRVLDIGMFTGYSALAMAEALPDGGEVVACEVDPYVAGIACECFSHSGSGGKIRVRVAPALSTMADLAAANQVFDLAFIDADKGGYGDYLDMLLDTCLLAPDGLVCVDNTLMQGQPYLGVATSNGAAIAAFNQKVVEDHRVEQVLIPVRDGLTLIRRA